MRVFSTFAVHCFPSADEEFRQTTQELIASTLERIQSTDGLVDEVQERLRARYPMAVVRLRDPVAELGQPEVQTLYAYRDGRAA